MFATLRNASVIGINKYTQDDAHAPGTGLFRGATRRRQATLPHLAYGSILLDISCRIYAVPPSVRCIRLHRSRMGRSTPSGGRGAARNNNNKSTTTMGTEAAETGITNETFLPLASCNLSVVLGSVPWVHSICWGTRGPATDDPARRTARRRNCACGKCLERVGWVVSQLVCTPGRVAVT